MCLAVGQLCDDNLDCADGEDEKQPGCNPPYGFCREDQWKCDNQDCISLGEYCDKKIDCYDESDEAYCDKAFSTHPPSCNPGYVFIEECAECVRLDTWLNPVSCEKRCIASKYMNIPNTAQQRPSGALRFARRSAEN